MKVNSRLVNQSIVHHVILHYPVGLLVLDL